MSRSYILTSPNLYDGKFCNKACQLHQCSMRYRSWHETIVVLWSPLIHIIFHRVSLIDYIIIMEKKKVPLIYIHGYLRCLCSSCGLDNCHRDGLKNVENKALTILIDKCFLIYAWQYFPNTAGLRRLCIERPLIFLQPLLHMSYELCIRHSVTFLNCHHLRSFSTKILGYRSKKVQLHKLTERIVKSAVVVMVISGPASIT